MFGLEAGHWPVLVLGIDVEEEPAENLAWLAQVLQENWSD